MNLTADTVFRAALNNGVEPPSLDSAADRRADLLAKQEQVAALLQEVGCEGLLVLEPENFAWLSSGATARGVIDPGEHPALYFNSEQRWLISSNVDSQRLFDEELLGLGFQLKEWPWHWGREQLLSDLCQGRQVACDRPLGDAKVVADQCRQRRMKLSPYEQACFRVLGQTVSHALEATCRTFNPGDTEREVAGHLGHRLLHRGILPLSVTVTADGRGAQYRRGGFTATPIQKSAVVGVTARKYGLYLTASRTVSFGKPDEDLQRQHDSACKISATYQASTWPDALPEKILSAGRRIYQLCDVEHEWALSPQGHLTGRLPVERPLLPKTEELFQSGWAVTWSVNVGAASSCDTFIVADEGPRSATPSENDFWPLKKIRVQGADFRRPDIYQR